MARFGRERVMMHPRSTAILSALFLLFIGSCAAGNAFAQKKPPAKPVNLNAATLAQLEELPGIGPATAQAIVKFREKSGPFERVEDLLAIRGISKARLEKLRPYVTVTPPAAKSAAQSAAHPSP